MCAPTYTMLFWLAIIGCACFGACLGVYLGTALFFWLKLGKTRASLDRTEALLDAIEAALT